MSPVSRFVPVSGGPRSLSTLALCVVGLTLFAPDASAQAISPSVSSLEWLAGCWAIEGGEPGSGEQWMLPAGGTMLGVGRTVRRGRAIAHEFMQIREVEPGRLAFIARPSNQQEASFPLLRFGVNEVVFENLAHDFPQRVTYRLIDTRTLHARVEGTVNGPRRGEDFPMLRISCEVTP